jgi:hypothetical protein
MLAVAPGGRDDVAGADAVRVAVAAVDCEGVPCDGVSEKPVVGDGDGGSE